jgi:hypothetical protein
MRYIGNIADINPKFDEVKLIWITNERVDWLADSFSNLKFPLKTSTNCPSFWFEYKSEIYYGIVEYELGFLEQYEDWEICDGIYFNEYDPKEEEFNQLTNFKIPLNFKEGVGEKRKTRYYKLDYVKAMQGDLGQWCKFELNFTKKWFRDRQIDSIL